MHASPQFFLEKGVLRPYFRQSAWGLFLLTCLVYVLVLLLQQTYVLTDAVYYETLGEQLTRARIADWLERQSRWRSVAYLLIPVLLAAQAFLIALCLNLGTVLLEMDVKFADLFGVVIRSLPVFALGKLVYVLILLGMELHSLDDLLGADWFSLLGWISREGIPEWMWYPLSVINVFEVGFWLLLSAGLAGLLSRSFAGSLRFLAATYGMGLLTWILFIMFLQLNIGI